MTAIGTLVCTALRARPDRVAFRHGDLELTYANTARWVDGLAARFAALPPETTVLQVRGNDPFQWVVAAACWVAGRRSAALAPGAVTTDRLAQLGPVVVLTDVPTPLEGAPPPVAGADVVVRLGFTSGTTGPPKGVELTSGALGAVATALADTLPWPDDPQVVCPEPLSGGFGNLVLPTLLRGGTVTVPTGPAPLSEPDLPPGSVLFAMTPTLRSLLDGPPGHPALVVYSGGSLAGCEVDRAHALFGEVLCQVFGQVEVPKTIAFSSPADHRGPHRTALGRPFPGTDVRIAADGELLVRGPTTARGYAFPHRSPVRDGWLHTGDRCRLDADGYLHFVERLPA